MRTVIVTAENNRFKAKLNEKETCGQTIGQTIDVLGEQFGDFEDQTLYILQKFQPKLKPDLSPTATDNIA